MAIRDDIEARMRQARKDRDDPTKNVIGMLKNKALMELKSGSDREDNDALWLEVIAAYAKQLKKALIEFEKAGERGIEAKAEAEFELRFCEQFLPKKLDEAQTEALVRKMIVDASIAGPAQMGKLMGMLMKNHSGEIDGGLARTVATRVLGESA